MPKIFSEQDKIVLRGKLLDAGIEELSHRRYASISIDEIVGKVGIAKGTFYHFFSSKEAYFYEIMQLIKEQNREQFKEFFSCGHLDREVVSECLFQRYTKIRTVYDYFTPEEMQLIVRKLPDGDSKNDSAEFAGLLCQHLNESFTEDKAETVVAMCNILAIAHAKRSVLKPDAYEKAIRFFCNAMAEYIYEGELT